MMSISEMEEYLNKNTHITQVIKGINIVSSTGERTGRSDEVEQVGVLRGTGSLLGGTDRVLGGTDQGAWRDRLWGAV